MFEHPQFDIYSIDDIPTETDLYLRSEEDMAAYEKSMLVLFAEKRWESESRVCFVAVQKINTASLELLWFTNIYDRYHRLSITLPRDKIRCCVGSFNWDEDPTIFVDSDWLQEALRQSKCVFAMIDASGVRDALSAGLDFAKTLPCLRSGVDEIASNFPDVSFISFADSIILKSHWTSGYFKDATKYSYYPESLLHIFKDVEVLFHSVLGLKAYGIFTQGSNVYEDSLLHISESKNHVCLNSLGAPFSDLKTIDETARRSIREGIHAPFDLYLDESYFLSLKLGGDAKGLGRKQRYPYTTALGQVEAKYVCMSADDVLSNLEV